MPELHAFLGTSLFAWIIIKGALLFHDSALSHSTTSSARVKRGGKKGDEGPPLFLTSFCTPSKKRGDVNIHKKGENIKSNASSKGWWWWLAVPRRENKAKFQVHMLMTAATLAFSLLVTFVASQWVAGSIIARHVRVTKKEKNKKGSGVDI